MVCWWGVLRMASRENTRRGLKKNRVLIIAFFLLVGVFGFGESARAEIYFEDDYETGAWAFNQNDWSYGSRGGSGNNSVVVSSDRAHSGNYSCKFTYADAPWAYVMLNYEGADSYTKIHRRFYVYFEDGFRMDGGNHLKFGKLESTGANNYQETWNIWWYDSFHTCTTGSNYFGQLQFCNKRTQWVEYAFGWYAQLSGTGCPLEQGFCRYPFESGRWYCFETRSKINTGGSSTPNGEHALWVDEQKIWEVTGVENDRSGLEQKIDHMEIYSGWFENGPPKVESIWFDDLVVSGSYIGPINATDTTPPLCSNPSPTGTLSSGTTQTNISLQTDVQAVCRYSNVPGTNYTNMTGTFTYTNSTNHSTQISGLENGLTCTFYVRCNSSDGYVNNDDFNITFSVDGHKADINDDRVIDMPELMLFIARWKANDGVTKAEVEEVKDIWFGGGDYGIN
ncbi:MAG: hypothetical protein U9M95_00055 [Candidatus Altiarchaeota archaeon]|nr:hypothetical protein [Candidatus Altiarchaeota archaeon]